MKILIDTDLMKFARVFASCKFQASGLNEKAMSAFDTFDSTSPDLFIVKESNLTNAVMKCIAERPELRTVVFKDDSSKVNALVSYIGNSFLEVEDYDRYADVIVYNKGNFVPELQCDLVCTEKMEYPNIQGYSFRIFNSEIINHKNYCGFVNEFKLKDIYRSAKAVLTTANRKEVILSGGNPLESFCPACLNVEYDHSEERKAILENETVFHLVAKILETLGCDREKNIVLNNLENFK